MVRGTAKCHVTKLYVVVMVNGIMILWSKAIVVICKLIQSKVMNLLDISHHILESVKSVHTF